jgi:eukaryotic-like serine/threonine-protein kinase
MTDRVIEATSRTVGRYVLHEEVGSGGMAVVHLGRLIGPVGFSRTVAIKHLHASYSHDPEFVAMFLDEARIAARIQHPNVVSTLDVVTTKGELFLVLEYVHGITLIKLLRESVRVGQKISPPVAISIGAGVLYGLHAAHEARRESGEPLEIVHRDVSPANVMIGADGVARVLDFGVAKASWRCQSTGEGIVKGKLKYMAPEHVAGKAIDRRTDVFAASVVIWEMLVGQQLIRSDTPGDILTEILARRPAPPSILVQGVPEALDDVVLRGLAPYPQDRYQTAHQMAVDLERALAPATTREVAEWVQRVGGDMLRELEEKRALSEAAVTPIYSTGIPSEPPSPGQLLLGAQAVPTVRPGPPRPIGLAASGDEAKAGSRGSDPARPNRRRLAGAIGAASAIALLLPLALFAALRTKTASSAIVQTMVSADSAGAASASATDVASDVASATAAVESAVVAAQGASEPNVQPLAAPSAKRPARGGTGKGGGAAWKGFRCQPPYTITADGVKRYKPDCF